MPGIICQGCGAQLNPGVKFCSECGAPVPQAPQAQTTCPVCGADVQPNASFCSICGNKLSGGAVTPPSSNIPQQVTSQKPEQDERYVNADAYFAAKAQERAAEEERLKRQGKSEQTQKPATQEPQQPQVTTHSYGYPMPGAQQSPQRQQNAQRPDSQQANHTQPPVNHGRNQAQPSMREAGNHSSMQEPQPTQQTAQDARQRQDMRQAPSQQEATPHVQPQPRPIAQPQQTPVQPQQGAHTQQPPQWQQPPQNWGPPPQQAPAWGNQTTNWGQPVPPQGTMVQPQQAWNPAWGGQPPMTAWGPTAPSQYGQPQPQMQSQDYEDDEDEEEQVDPLSYLAQNNGVKRKKKKPQNGETDSDNLQQTKKKKKKSFQETVNQDGYYDEPVPMDGGYMDTGKKQVQIIPIILGIIGIALFAFVAIQVQGLL